MMTAERRRLLFVGGLVVLLVVVLVMRPGNDPPAVPLTTPSNPQGGGAAPPRELPVTDVKLELLEAHAESLAEADRNPFRFAPKAPPPAPPRPRPPGGIREFTPSPVPSGPPPPPPIPLRFIGFAKSGATIVAYFTPMSGGANFEGKVGDVIEGRYKILRIDPESVELTYLDGRGRQTIRASGP